MNESNLARICEYVEILVLSANCSEEITDPAFPNCSTAIWIHRFLAVDCRIKQLFRPTAAILVFIGTILNLFSLYCFVKMHKRNSQNVYLCVLSLSDTINLQVNFTIPLLRQWEKIDDFFGSLKLICQFNGFFTEFFLIFPTWIIVLLTFERFICVLLPLQRYSLFTPKRAKFSVFALAFSVVCLSLYRFFDLKGIDQVSVFSIPACDFNLTTSIALLRIRYLNLIIWTILPECLTLIMSLVIIYNIKLASRTFKPYYSEVRQKKNSQATKTVLLISILFLTCHTPTGITIFFHFFFVSQPTRTVGLVVVLVSRRITVILYEISLCCKFFIYNRTFRNFKDILHQSLSRFTRQTNSAKLGRRSLGVNYAHNHAKIFQSNPKKSNHLSQAKETDALVRPHPKNSIRTSPSTSRASREQQQQQQLTHSTRCDPPVGHGPLFKNTIVMNGLTAVITKTNADIQVSIVETPNLLRRYTESKVAVNNRLLWRGKPQITL